MMPNHWSLRRGHQQSVTQRGVPMLWIQPWPTALHRGRTLSLSRASSFQFQDFRSDRGKWEEKMYWQMQRSSGLRAATHKRHQPVTSSLGILPHTRHNVVWLTLICLGKNKMNRKRIRANLWALPCLLTDVPICFQSQGCTERQSVMKRRVISVLYRERRSPAFDLCPRCPSERRRVLYTSASVDSKRSGVKIIWQPLPVYFP